MSDCEYRSTTNSWRDSTKQDWDLATHRVVHTRPFIGCVYCAQSQGTDPVSDDEPTLPVSRQEGKS